ncbi:MAG: protein kinase, partial [Deltaproteobacteria bacterium]|nr:protein kinase [Kofleriaceae bacterium]
EHTVPARHPLPAALLSAAPGAPGIGSRLGRYELVEHLGAGAMGVVFEARDTELDRRVAVKIVSPRTGDADTARTRLRREAQAMARLSHPNVAAVFDIGTVGDQLFIAMELVRGKTLRALVGEDRPWRELLPILLAAARGLAAAHEAGVVHRDFKPDNVLLREDGAVRVSDFGLAREAADRTDRPRAADSGDAALDALVTATGAIVGTPAYLAPESARGIADAATDQFAFAVTAFELLEGRRPFESAHIVELLRGERTDLPMRPWRRRDLPAPLRATTERALAMAPAARWPSMDDLVGRLERAAERPTRTRVLLAALAAAGVMGAIAIARALTHEAPRPPVTAGLAAASLRWSETPLTFQGDLAAPVLSPDGELVAAFDTSGVVLVPTGGGEPRGIDLEPPPGAGYRRLTWSADGKRLLAMYMSSAQTFHSLSIDVSTHAMAPTPIGGGHALLIDEQLVVAAFPPDKALGFKSSAGTERSRCAIPGDYEWIDGLQAAQNAIYVEITWSDSTRALVVTDRACSSVRTAVPRSTVVDFVVGADGVIRAIRREEDGEVLVEYDSTGEPSGAPRHLPLGTSLLAGVRRDGGAVIMRRSTTWRLVDSGASATRELARATSRASLRLSPDQRRFAVVEFRPRKIPTLYIADRSNLNARGTALAEGVIAADWSLDGNSLAVITRSAAGIDLETIDVASGERRSSGSSDISPQGDVLWLDDRRIAYLRADHRTYQSFDRVTGTTQPIVDPSHGWTLGLARSPLDGSLAILWNRPDGPGVWLVSEDGASRWIRNTQGAWTFAWAHDGSLWMVEGARIDRYDPRTERVEPIRDLALEPTAQITAIFPLTDDHVLVQIENTTSDLVLFAPIASSNTGP